MEDFYVVDDIRRLSRDAFGDLSVKIHSMRFLLFVTLVTGCFCGLALAGDIAAPAMTVTPIYLGSSNMLGMIGTARQSTEEATNNGLIGEGASHSSAGGAQAHTRGNDLHVADDPSVSAQVRRTYLGTLAQSSGQATANQADRTLGDIHSTFAQMTSPFGLRGDDFADVMTAYTAIVWMAANRQTDLPSVAQVQGLRQQMRAVLAGKLPDPRQRQLLAETMMYQSCMLVLLRQQANGDPKALETIAQSIDKGAPQQGKQMRGLALTNQGLVRR